MSPLYKKLLLWFCAANIAVLLISVFVTDRIGRYAVGNEPEWSQIASATLKSYEHGGVLGLSKKADELRRRQGIDATLYRGRENLLKRRPSPPLRPFLNQLLGSKRLVLRAGEGRWLVGIALTSEGGESLHFIAMRGPPPPHARRHLLLLVQIALSLLVIAALGFWVARSLTEPIRAIQTATRKMADGDLAARADAATAARRDELGALARDFNHMAARTETLVGQQRTVLQDVSHELRSPLARLHLLLELAGQGATADGHHQLDRATKEVSRLDCLIGEVLNLSRLEAALPGMATLPVLLDTLLQDVADEHRPEAEARQLNVKINATKGLIVQADASLLARALGNVLGNAIKFSAIGATVELSCAAVGAMAELCVRDHGPGVAAENMARLFQPFYRGDNAALAEGHGLGLAIAQRIAKAHGGSIVAENAAAGGFVVRLCLPLMA